MNFNKYSFWGIQDLCRTHYREILERKKLSSVLDNRQVRFIDPLGNYCYANFGDFYNGSFDTMILISREKKYTLFHEPDVLSNTLWSTIPVIYAGVETGIRDANKNKIFTGDIVSYKGYTSVVRFFGSNTIAGLAGDNCEVLFEGGGPIEKVGTVFSDISRGYFQRYDYERLQWPLDCFVPHGLSRNELTERAQKSLDKPCFIEPAPITKRWIRPVYDNLSEYLCDDDILVYFIGEEYEDEEYGQCNDVIADDYPEEFKGETLAIHLPKDEWSLQSWKETIHDFFLTAHHNPDKRYVFCDFRRSQGIPKRQEHDFAMTFYDWYEFNIPNVALPLWIYICHGGHDCVGRD